MNLQIKPLTPDLTSSYLDFFDNRAFSDGNPNGPCYCTDPMMDATSAQQMVSEFGNDIKGTIRRYAVKMLAEGQIHGYLAFDGATPVGWCNATERVRYSNNWIPESARKDAPGKIISVVCFTIAPEYRGKGVAAALLERVCDDAKDGGFALVEGYARLDKDHDPLDFNGPIQLFERAGFTEVARQGDIAIMRKELQ